MSDVSAAKVCGKAAVTSGGNRWMGVWGGGLLRRNGPTTLCPET